MCDEFWLYVWLTTMYCASHAVALGTVSADDVAKQFDVGVTY